MRKFIELNATEFTDLCKSHNACGEGILWIAGKSAKEFVETCYRGDWMLWLFKRIAPNDLKTLTLAKGHCANTVRHLMKDERSKKAVDAAISFGEGKITREELNAAAYAAAAYAAADAAYAAAAANAAAAYAANAYAANADRQKNRLLTANLCRQYLTFSSLEI